MVESSEKTWSTGRGTSKPLQYSCLENPMNSMKKHKNMTLKDEPPRSVGAQYAAGDKWRNNSRKKRRSQKENNTQLWMCVITDLEPDILEFKVKWALGSIALNKASGGDGMPVELFQLLKDDAAKVLHSVCQQIRKTQQ